MMNKLKNKTLFYLVTIAVSLILQGCTPIIEKFRYISLANISDIEILKYDRYRLGKTFFHKEMPIKYMLKKEKYVLYFEAYDHSAGTSLIIWAQDRSGKRLDILGLMIEGSCGGFKQHSYKNPHYNNVGAKYYSWGVQTRYCIPSNGYYKTAVDPKHLVISFKVLNGNQTLGIEAIPFQWESNGYYIWNDSL